MSSSDINERAREEYQLGDWATPADFAADFATKERESAVQEFVYRALGSKDWWLDIEKDALKVIFREMFGKDLEGSDS